MPAKSKTSTRGRGRGRGRDRGLGRTTTSGHFDEFPRVVLATPGRVLPSRRESTFEQVMSRYEYADEERQARYAREDEASAEIDAEEQSTESESEVEVAPVSVRARIPAHIQPISVRTIPTRGVSSTETQEEPTIQPEAWVAEMALTAPEVGPEPEAEPEPQTPEPVVGNKRNRGQLKTKGSVKHNKAVPKTRNPESWTVAWKCFRKTFYTEAAAHAALAHWKTEDLCPGCERPEILTCDQYGHQFGEGPVQAQPEAQAQPEPQAQLAAQAPPQSIRCTAIAAGVVRVTINGITLTINGDFTYP